MRYKLIVAGAALVLAAPAFADAWDFVLTNDTGKDIKTIELSATGADKWQPNKIDTTIQKGDPIKAGGRTTVHFDKDAQCKWDVKLTFTDASTQTWSGINLCDDSFVTLHLKNGAPTFNGS